MSMYKRLAVTDLVTQRFYWSPRDLKVVLFSSQIGCQLCGDRFCLGNVGTLCNFVTTYLQLISDEAVIDQCFIGDWSQFGCKVVSKHALII